MQIQLLKYGLTIKDRYYVKNISMEERNNKCER